MLSPSDERHLFQRLLSGLDAIPAPARAALFCLLAEPMPEDRRERFAQHLADARWLPLERLDALRRIMPAPPGPLQPASDARTVVGSEPMVGTPQYRSAPAATPQDARLAETRAVDGGVGYGSAEAMAADDGGLLYSRYHLLQMLGQGGMGVVWKVWDTDLARVVALKQTRMGGDLAGLLEQRFRREAQLAARLRHPGIVGIYDIGAAAGVCYLTMDFIAGRALDRALEEHRSAVPSGQPRDPQRLRRELTWLAEVAEAIGFAHAGGVLHRDLKPANVMLAASAGGDERAVVMDFGLAREVQDSAAAQARLTIAGQAVGTPAYMSPEQATGESARLGPATDVWALGVILYEILTGRMPFAGDVHHEVMTRIVREEPAAPRAVDPKVAPELEALCLAALDKEPARRFPSATQFGLEVRRWLSGTATGIRPESAFRRAARSWQRNPLLGLTALAVVLAIVLAAGLLLSSPGRDAQRMRAALGPVSEAVRRFEDQVLRTPMALEARTELAAQPLRTIENWLAEHPDAGGALALRGRIHQLLGDTAAAEDDYARAIDRASTSALARYWRGSSWIEKYRNSRGLPGAQNGPGGLVFHPQPPESVEQRAWRERGLADLVAVRPEADDYALLDAADLACGLAVLDIHAHTEAGYLAAERRLASLSEPKALKLRGLALYHLQRFAEAETAFSALMDSWPEDHEARHYRGLTQLALALLAGARGEDPRPQYAAAIVDFARLTERAPGWLEPRMNLGVTRMLIGDAENAQGIDARPRYREALVDLNGVVSAQPHGSSSRSNRALIHKRLGEAEVVRGNDPRSWYAAAEQDLDEAIRLEPSGSSAWSNRGEVREIRAGYLVLRGEDATSDFERAIADYTQAIELQPDAPRSWLNRAQARHHYTEQLTRLGQDPRTGLTQAAADADAALLRDPDCAEAYNTRGLIYRALGEYAATRGVDPRPQFQRALADLDRALASNPTFPNARMNRGNTWVQMGLEQTERGADPRAAFTNAVADFDAAIAQQPGEFTHWHNRGHAWHSLGLWEHQTGQDAQTSLTRAIDDYGVALKLNASHVTTWNGRGAAWFKLADARARAGLPFDACVRGALTDLDRAIELNPRFGEAFCNRGLIRETVAGQTSARGDDARALHRQAIDDFSKALDLAPGLQVAMTNRGVTWLNLAIEEASRGGDPLIAADRAVADFTTALAANPRLGLAHTQRGLTHLRRANWLSPDADAVAAALQAGEADLRAAVAEGQADAGLHLARVLVALKRYDEAIQAYETLARTLPRLADAAQRGIDQARLAALEAGEAWAAAILEGHRLIQRGNYAQAREAYEEALAATDKLPPARLTEPLVRHTLASARYNLACIAALAVEGRSAPGATPVPPEPAAAAALRDLALAELAAACELGFSDAATVAADPDLTSIRSDPRFPALLERARAAGGK